jgi:hypothetical protein
MRITLHIGTDKAGSTAIQSHLALNREWLSERGIYVPKNFLGPNNGHAELFSDLSNAALQCIRDEIDTAAAGGFEEALLSWEGLNFYDAAQIRRLSDTFQDMDAHIILYVREQAEIVQSGFLEEIKQLANTCPITMFQSPSLILRLGQQRKGRYPASRNYYQLARRWERGMGKNGVRVSVRVFDRQQLLEGDIVADFLKVLGLTADASFVRQLQSANPSLDAVSGYLIGQLRELGIARPELERLVDVALSSIVHDGPGEQYFLDADTVQKIRHHFKGSNQKLARRYLNGKDHPFDLSKPAAAEAGEAGVRAGVYHKLRQLAAIDVLPTFTGEGVAGTAIASAGLLEHGWCQAEPELIWCDGELSTLKFRVMRQQLMPEHTHLHIYIRGRYRDSEGDADGVTGVSINGADRGVHRLGHDKPGLNLLLSDLGPYDAVLIELQHQGGFALEFFGFELVGEAA